MHARLTIVALLLVQSGCGPGEGAIFLTVTANTVVLAFIISTCSSRMTG
jgi:hypothetical protein